MVLLLVYRVCTEANTKEIITEHRAFFAFSCLKYTCLFSKDHWCLEAVSLLTQVTCHLELRTTWSNASCLTDWIERRCEFQYSAGQKCYKTTLPAFSGLRLVIQPQPSHDRAFIIVHSK